MTVNAPRTGAWRAAALLNALERDGKATRTGFPALFRDPLTGAHLPWGPPSAGNGLNQAWRRAIGDLRDLGVPLVVDGDIVKLDRLGNPRTDRHLSLTVDETWMVGRAHEVIRDVDPLGRAEPQRDVLLKHHMHDELEFRYGGRDYTGTPIFIESADRPVLQVQCGDEVLGFHIDAIAAVRVRSTRGHASVESSTSRRLVEADPVEEQFFTRTPGKPTTGSKLRQAQRAVTAIRSVATDARPTATWDALARLTGDDRPTLASLHLTIRSLEPRAELTDDGYELVRGGRETRLLGGGSALAARLALGAIGQLGADALTDLLECDRVALEGLTARLDAFLSRIELPSVPAPSQAGTNLALAALEHYSLDLKIDGRPGWRTLDDIGLHWDGEQWWVLGHLPDTHLEAGDLALRAVRRTK